MNNDRERKIGDYTKDAYEQLINNSTAKERLAANDSGVQRGSESGGGIPGGGLLEGGGNAGGILSEEASSKLLAIRTKLGTLVPR